LIKPNGDELAEAFGSPIHNLGDVTNGARKLLERGLGHVLVTLGSEGAVSVSDSVALRAWTASVVPRSTVGAGDAALAGFLSTWDQQSLALRTAVAWGAAAVELPGTGMPGPGDIDLDGVTVEELEAGPVLDARRGMG
jgi:1-phosphofructokinase